MTTSDKIQLLMVIATSASIILPQIIRLIIFYRPNISIEVNDESAVLFTPCFDKEHNEKFISVKIRIHNKGKITAEMLQVRVLKVEFKNIHNHRVLKFPPLKLYCSYQDDRKEHGSLLHTMKKIQPKTFEDYDFLEVLESKKFCYFNSVNDAYTIKDNGNYIVQLLISCDNHKSIKKRISFDFDNKTEKFIHNLRVLN